MRKQTACLDAEEEEEADDSSSSSQLQNVDELLDNFRKEWHKELHHTPKPSNIEDNRFKETHSKNWQDDEENVRLKWVVKIC